MSLVTEQHSVVKSGVYRHAHAKRTPVRLVSRFLKDREAHAFHRWIRPVAEQRSRTRISWRAASAVVILDGCESGGHYMAILATSCLWLGIAVCCVTSRLRSRPSSLLSLV